MMTDPDPTEVMPTSSPPRAPTSKGGDRADDRVRLACLLAGAEASQLDVEAQGVRRRCDQQREPDRLRQRLVDLGSGEEPVEQVGPEEGEGHRAGDQEHGEPQMR
jgi:hypothetical protein